MNGISKATESKLGWMASWLGSFPQMGGITKLIDVDITVDTAAYADGDVIGTLLTVPGVRQKGSSGIITSITLISNLAAADVEVFAFTGSITPAADNAAFAPSFADMQKSISLSDDRSSLSLSTWETIGSRYVTSKSNINAPFNVDNTEENLYILLVANGVIDFVAAADLHLRVGILLD